MRTPGDSVFRDRLAVRPVRSWRCWLVGAVVWLAVAPLAEVPRHSGNVWSRYMTVESLVERGTLAIERSPLLPISGSPDVIRVGSHVYSDKPPVLSTAAAAVYLPLNLAGLRFSGSPARFVPAQFTTVNWVLVMAFAGLGSALTVVGLRKLLQTVNVPRGVADVLAIACGLGTQVLTYAVTFNNHSVAMGLITLALAQVVLEDKVGPPRRARSRFVTGLLAGLAATIDLPAGGAFLLVIAAWLGLRDRRMPWWCALGCAGPLAIHAVLQTLVTGSPLPAEMTPQLLGYNGSYWAGAGKWVEHGPRIWFGLELLFGPQGWLTVTPVLIIGLASLAWIAGRRGDPLQPASIAVSAMVAILLVYYTWGVRRTDFAGSSFGTRHLLAIAPAVFWFAIVGLTRPRSGMARVLSWLLFTGLFSIGIVYAIAGMRDPWSRVDRRHDVALEVVKHLTLYPYTSYDR